jgi:hypothetical protein
VGRRFPSIATAEVSEWGASAAWLPCWTTTSGALLGVDCSAAAAAAFAVLATLTRCALSGGMSSAEVLALVLEAAA